MFAFPWKTAHPPSFRVNIRTNSSVDAPYIEVHFKLSERYPLEPPDVRLIHSASPASIDSAVLEEIEGKARLFLSQSTTGSEILFDAIEYIRVCIIMRLHFSYLGVGVHR